MLNFTTIGEIEASVHAAVPELSAETVRRFAERIVRETDERLEGNVREWLEGRPLTNTVLGDYSVPLIMQIRGNNDFFGALTAMNDYLADPETGARRIWRLQR